MRRLLVEQARARAFQKRGGGAPHVTFDENLANECTPRQVVVLNDALSALALEHERKARVVELRYFGGLSVEETAAVLDVSPETVMRDWKFAKHWLLRELSRESRGGRRAR